MTNSPGNNNRSRPFLLNVPVDLTGTLRLSVESFHCLASNVF